MFLFCSLQQFVHSKARRYINVNRQPGHTTIYNNMKNKKYHTFGIYVKRETYTISLEMPVPSQGHYGFHSFPVVD